MVRPVASAIKLADDGVFPNSSLPVLLYQGLDPERVRRRLHDHGWGSSWIDGIYDFPHYHSTAHEALLVLMGVAQVQLGGPSGTRLELEQGDALVLPAGVAHQCLSCSADFRVMGAYPLGQNYDMMYGQPAERPAADQRIASVPLPQADPFFGSRGDLLDYWREPASSEDTLSVP